VFNAGQIEQIASPGDIYTRPATAFVADFVGESNLLPGRVRAGRIELDDIGTSVPDTEGRTEGDEVQVAIRSENVGLSPSDDASASGAARIEMLEYAGLHSKAHLTAARTGKRLTAIVSPAEAVGLRVGQGMRVEIKEFVVLDR